MLAYTNRAHAYVIIITKLNFFLAIFSLFLYTFIALFVCSTLYIGLHVQFVQCTMHWGTLEVIQNVDGLHYMFSVAI